MYCRCRYGVAVHFRRAFASKQRDTCPDNLVEKPNPHFIKHDYIGPPDKLSNIRPFVRRIRIDETETEKQLRLKQIEVEDWNQTFWSRHNQRFYDEKEEFIQMLNKAGVNDISADKMSEFYKHFLDKNRKIHIYYNFSWYIKNFHMLFLAIRVEMARLFTSIRKAKHKPDKDTHVRQS